MIAPDSDAVRCNAGDLSVDVSETAFSPDELDALAA